MRNTPIPELSFHTHELSLLSTGTILCAVLVYSDFGNF